MKKALIIFASLMIVSVTCFATVPADHPKLAEYFSLRFIKISHGSDWHHIDYNQVQSVVLDKSGNQGVVHAPSGNPTIGKNMWWIFFKNGQWQVVGQDGNPEDKWKLYRDFLQANPQFLSIP